MARDRSGGRDALNRERNHIPLPVRLPIFGHRECLVLFLGEPLSHCATDRCGESSFSTFHLPHCIEIRKAIRAIEWLRERVTDRQQRDLPPRHDRSEGHEAMLRSSTLGAASQCQNLFCGDLVETWSRVRGPWRRTIGK